jgi:hypothetical protein
MRTALTCLAGAVALVLVGPGRGVAADAPSDVRDLLLPGVARAVERGMRVEVVEPRRVEWRRAYKLATEKYGRQARLGPNGELLDYVAGLPFLDIDPADPQVAHKIVWNYALGPWTADDATAWSFEWETGKHTAGSPMRVESRERQDAEQSKWIRLIGRTEVPPLPAVPDNDEQVMHMEIFGPTLPVFLTVLRSGPMLTYRYLTLKEDDVWYYTAWDRRSRRISATIRYESFGDVVIDLNSSFGLNVPHGSYTWRFLGERPMLAVMHGRHYPAAWCPGGGDFAPCDVWERRTAYVVEGTAVLPYDTYGKRIVAVDREGWVVLATDLHDKPGALWKTWINFWSYRPYAGGGPGAEEYAYLLAGSGVDFEADKAIRWRLPGTRPLADAVKLNTGLTVEEFNPSQLGTAFGSD